MNPMPLIVFAQAKGPPPEALAGAGIGIALLITIWAIAILLSLFTTILFIWYLITAYSGLSAVSERNRDMEPGMVFLVFIPVFGPIWQFFVVLRMASSLEKEFEDRGISSDGDFGRTLGLSWLILYFLCCTLPIGIICKIMYIMKIRGYINQMYKTRGRKSSRRTRDDDDD